MSTPSPETHVFVGMFRPPMSADQVEECPGCHKHYETSEVEKCEVLTGMYPDPQISYHYVKRYRWERRLKCWLDGHFDEPVYRTIEEVVRMRQDAQVDLLPARQGT